MEEIKKFKNGKIAFRIDERHGWYLDRYNVLTDEYYHQLMFFSDLYIQQINGYAYIVDTNTRLVYNIGSYLVQNPLQYVLDCITEAHSQGKAYYIYPLTKKESADLFQDLENGY